MNPGLLGLVGAPTYRMLQDSTQRTFFEVLAAEGIDYAFNKQENRLRFSSNGSEIIFRTMENPERLRGANLAWFALDELYLHPRRSLDAHSGQAAASGSVPPVRLRCMDTQRI